MQPENEADEWMTRALFAAAATHRAGFLAEAAKNSPSEKSLSSRLVAGIDKEVYALQRRANILLPPDVTGKEIIVKGSIAKGNRTLEGFIMGQGGQDAGYGLYVKDNHLVMARKAGRSGLHRHHDGPAARKIRL